MNYQIIGTGEPLVLIHGLGQTQNAWELQIELSDNYQLYIPTLRGHGDSLITTGMTLNYFAKDILQMLDDNGIQSAHFCGLSLGGVIVQEIFKQSPGRVKSMILANTTSYVPSFSFDLGYTERIRILNKYTDEQYINHTVLNTLHMPTNKEIEQAIHTFHLNRDSYIPSSKAIRGINYLPLLCATTTPIYIISSSDDKVTPSMYNAQVIKMWVHRAKMSVLPDTGHLSNIQKPMEFNNIVRNFINN